MNKETELSLEEIVKRKRIISKMRSGINGKSWKEIADFLNINRKTLFYFRKKYMPESF